jgi:hypothetical protein
MIYITRGTRGKLRFRFTAGEGVAQPGTAHAWLVHKKHGPLGDMPIVMVDEGDGVWSVPIDSRGWYPGLVWGHARTIGEGAVGKDFQLMCIANAAHAHIPAP